MPFVNCLFACVLLLLFNVVLVLPAFLPAPIYLSRAFLPQATCKSCLLP